MIDEASDRGHGMAGHASSAKSGRSDGQLQAEATLLVHGAQGEEGLGIRGWDYHRSFGGGLSSLIWCDGLEWDEMGEGTSSRGMRRGDPESNARNTANHESHAGAEDLTAGKHAVRSSPRIILLGSPRGPIGRYSPSSTGTVTADTTLRKPTFVTQVVVPDTSLTANIGPTFFSRYCSVSRVGRSQGRDRGGRRRKISQRKLWILPGGLMNRAASSEFYEPSDGNTVNTVDSRWLFVFSCRRRRSTHHPSHRLTSPPPMPSIPSCRSQVHLSF